MLIAPALGAAPQDDSWVVFEPCGDALPASLRLLELGESRGSGVEYFRSGTVQEYLALRNWSGSALHIHTLGTETSWAIACYPNRQHRDLAMQQLPGLLGHNLPVEPWTYATESTTLHLVMLPVSHWTELGKPHRAIYVQREGAPSMELTAHGPRPLLEGRQSPVDHWYEAAEFFASRLPVPWPEPAKADERPGAKTNRNVLVATSGEPTPAPPWGVDLWAEPERATWVWPREHLVLQLRHTGTQTITNLRVESALPQPALELEVESSLPRELRPGADLPIILRIRPKDGAPAGVYRVPVELLGALPGRRTYSRVVDITFVIDRPVRIRAPSSVSISPDTTLSLSAHDPDALGAHLEIIYPQGVRVDRHSPAAVTVRFPHQEPVTSTSLSVIAWSGVDRFVAIPSEQSIELEGAPGRVSLRLVVWLYALAAFWLGMMALYHRLTYESR